MLRITVEEGVAGNRLLIEGRLVGVWADEAARYWNSLLTSRRQVVALVDVRGVMAIDAAGKALLQDMHRRGVRLVTSGCLMNNLVADLGQDSECSDEAARMRKTRC